MSVLATTKASSVWAIIPNDPFVYGSGIELYETKADAERVLDFSKSLRPHYRIKEVQISSTRLEK